MRLVTLVTRAARLRGVGPNEVPDLVQEVRIALWQKGMEEHVAEGWVFGVASHKAIDLVRRIARDRLRNREAPACRSCRDVELEYLLNASVAALAPRLREFFQLHYRQALSEREVAKELKMCRASVRWLDRCCRRRLAASACGAAISGRILRN
jgi:RNA polymerase sigma factor (sigma-70 family)